MKILVIGDIMLDEYIYGECNRISPEAPVQVFEYKSSENRLGGAANVANNIASFGFEVDLIGLVGNDKNSEKILSFNKNTTINFHLVKKAGFTTIVKQRYVQDNHQILRVDYEKKIDSSINFHDTIFSKISDLVSKNEYKSIIVSDYNKGIIDDKLIKKITNSFDLKVFVDPKVNDVMKYEGAYLIKPNKKEAELMVGFNLDNENKIKDACKFISKKGKIANVIVTLSDLGLAFYNENIFKIIEANKVEVSDVTGAGDTFISALVYYYSVSKDLKKACHFANYCSSVSVSKFGTSVLTQKEIKSWKNF
jgi:D-beta-D-heptose 7-phosphate kinase/D-beta-D-heptose 1-phosphate adenosyltransferase